MSDLTQTQEWRDACNALDALVEEQIASDSRWSTSDALTAALPHLRRAIEREALGHAVGSAAIKWCGQKSRETSQDDVAYFWNNWQALPGLKAFVAHELLARALSPKEPT